MLDQLGISKLDLKRQNRMQILKIIKQKGPTSRIDIANTLELTRAAVTIITNEMIDQGVIVEKGEFKQTTERAHRGRKKILLDINHNYKFAVGIIVEKNYVGIGLSTLAGEVLDKRNMSINDASTFKDILRFIEKSLGEIMDYNCLKTDAILGIGVGVYPTMYEKMHIIVDNKSTVFTGLKEAFESFTHLPVVVDNYIKGAAMANIDFLKEKDPNRHNIAFLSYGETFNFVVTNLYDPIVSYDNRTNFVDKMIINPYSEYDNGSGIRRGCVQYEITPSAVVKKLSKVFSKDDTPYLYKLCNGDINRVTRSMMFDALQNGDDNLMKTYTDAVALTAVLVNNLVFSTNPQKFVMHDFKFNTKEFTYFKNTLEGIAGGEISKMIDLSIIEDKNRFLAGSAIAIRELFFLKGGFNTTVV